MNDEQLDSRLSRISTAWTLIRDAHGASSDAAVRAQHALMERYHGAAYRYLLGALRDPDEADELFQQFALRFVRGDFRRADPGRGRFRNYVRTALINLVTEYKRRAPRRAREKPLNGLEPIAPIQQHEGDFLESWRGELLARTWTALAEIEREGGQPFFSVLRFRTGEPKLSSAELARRLTGQLRPESPFTPTSVRKVLQRAREKFSDLLLEEVSHSLQQPSRGELEQELIELRLKHYCAAAFERRFG